MKIIVQKYGGSSVAGVEKIKQVAQLASKVKAEEYGLVVVVSAMGKTTNELIEMVKSITSNPSKREMDMLLSTGERTSMSLLCMAFNELGVDSISLTGSQAGIVTNDRHNDARVIEVRPFRVQDELEKGKVVVVGGFQGVSYRRDITTLGRGGSDTTAIALAAALKAERCEIYSDVDGVYSADPSVVKNAGHLPELSYQQMQEMALAGAKVMNANAVQFAKEAQIAIYARSTFQPGRETVIRMLAPGMPKGVKAVVSEKEIIRVHIKSFDTFKNVLALFEQKEIPLKELNVHGGDITQSEISFLISTANVYGWEKIKEELAGSYPGDISFDNNLSALSLIGEGLNSDVSVLSETISHLLAGGIGIYGITTTNFRISMIVKRSDVEESVKLCHEKWIEEKIVTV